MKKPIRNRERFDHDLVVVKCACCKAKITLLECPYVSFFDHRDIPLAVEVCDYGPMATNKFQDGHICSKCWEKRVERVQ